MEVWKRFLMARNELFKAANETLKADDESFMKAVHTVRDSINENNTTLSFFSELEKSITKDASGQKQQQTAKKENNTSQKKFKVPFAKKNSEEEIPTGKVSFSSAKMLDTMGQKNTLLGKSSGVQDDKKLCADNTIPLNSPIKRSPSKEYRYNEFERSGRLSRNRTRELKGKNDLCLFTFCV